MKKLEVDISDNLHDRLYRVVPDPAFLWRNRGETAYRAVERAVEAALKRFLDRLESGTRTHMNNEG
jgi:hypothetical protein